MSVIPQYTRTEINSLRIGPLKDALAALGLPFNGGVGDGRKSLKAALYPPSVGTVAASQPNPGPPSQPPGASGTANPVSASQPNLSPAPLIQPSVQVEVVQAEIREQWHLIEKSRRPVYTRIPVASRNKASQVFGTLLNNTNKNNGEQEWQKFFGFAQNGLGSSTRGGKKHTSQATIINKRLDAFVSGAMVAEPPLKKTAKVKTSNPHSQTSLVVSQLN